MHFFQSKRKGPNQILVRKTHEKPQTAMRFLTPKKLRCSMMMGKVTQFFISLRLKCCCRITREKGRDLTQSYDKSPYTPPKKIPNAT